MFCSYCTSFANSKEKIDKDTRYCAVKNLYVSRKKKMCGEFKPIDLFWCIKNNYWLDMKTCSSRQMNAQEGCVRCSQGRIIKDIRRSRR